MSPAQGDVSVQLPCTYCKEVRHYSNRLVSSRHTAPRLHLRHLSHTLLTNTGISIPLSLHRQLGSPLRAALFVPCLSSGRTFSCWLAEASPLLVQQTLASKRTASLVHIGDRRVQTRTQGSRRAEQAENCLQSAQCTRPAFDSPNLSNFTTSALLHCMLLPVAPPQHALCQ